MTETKCWSCLAVCGWSETGGMPAWSLCLECTAAGLLDAHPHAPIAALQAADYGLNGYGRLVDEPMARIVRSEDRAVRRCQVCRHFVPELPGRQQVGQCRRYPSPVIVFRSHCCGEYEQAALTVEVEKAAATRGTGDALADMPGV